MRESRSAGESWGKASSASSRYAAKRSTGMTAAAPVRTSAAGPPARRPARGRVACLARSTARLVAAQRATARPTAERSALAWWMAGNSVGMGAAGGSAGGAGAIPRGSRMVLRGSFAGCSIAAPPLGPHLARSTGLCRTSMPIHAESGNPAEGGRWENVTWRPLDQAAVAGPAGQLVAAGQLQLAQHRGDVGLDRLHRQVQPAGDLLVGEAAGDVAQDLALPGRELVQLGVGDAGQVAVEGVEHEPGQAGREHGVPALDPADGGGHGGRGGG